MLRDEILGHATIVRDLAAARASDHLPHALLFVGPDGIGKALVARWLLSLRYCTAPENAEACGRCPACSAIARRDFVDLDVVTRSRGKRDIGIDSIRSLMQALHLSSGTNRGRSAILDGAERMTEEAQNSFLKTLEEPPPGVLIILIATSLDRLLPTIRSRCSRIRFAPLSLAEMRAFALRRGIDLNGVPLELARGSPGALLSLSDKAIQEGRILALSPLLDRTFSPFDFAARLIAVAERGAEEIPSSDVDPDAPELPSDASEVIRTRLLQFVTHIEWAIRDIVRLQEGVAGGLAHADRASQLVEVASRIGRDDSHALAQACSSTKTDLRRNVDRALALSALALTIVRTVRRTG